MRLIFCLFCFFCLFSYNPDSLHSQETKIPFVLFQDLVNESYRYQDQTIRTRGFLYYLDGKLILSAQPNVKTCCLALHPQIFILSQTLIASDHATTLEGFFSQTEGLFFLDHASEVKTSQNKVYFILIMVLLFGLSGYLMMNLSYAR